MKKKTILFLDLTLFSILFFVGSVTFVVNIYKLSKYEPMLWKPKTTGVVVESGVYEKTVASETFYRPRVTFRYSVDGQIYLKNAVENQELFDYDDLRPSITNNPVGKEIPVYYPSEKPNEAIFQSGIGTKFNATRPHMRFALFGLLLTVIMLIAIIRNDSYYIDRKVAIAVFEPYQRFFTGFIHTHGTPNYDQDDE